MVCDNKRRMLRQTASMLIIICCMIFDQQYVNAYNFYRLQQVLEDQSNDHYLLNQKHPIELNNTIPLDLFVKREECNTIYPIFNASGLTCDETFVGQDNLIQDCYGCRFLLVQLKISAYQNENGDILYMFIALSQLSSIFLLLVGFFILLNKKFSKHPYPLIGLALIFQAMVFQGQYLLYYVFPLKMPQFTTIYLYTMSFLDFKDLGQKWTEFSQMHVNDLNTLNQKTLYRTLEGFILTWKAIFYTGTLLQISINSMIFTDLWLALRNPFYPRRKRNKYYNTALSFLFIYIILIMSTNVNRKGATLDLTDYYKDSFFYVLGQKSFFYYIIIFIGIPFILVVNILYRQGTSKDLRKKLIKYQMLYFAVYSINLIQCTYDLWDLQSELVIESEAFQNFLFVVEIIFAIVGIPMAIIRLIEPYVWREFQYQCYIFIENIIQLPGRIARGIKNLYQKQNEQTIGGDDEDDESLQFENLTLKRQKPNRKTLMKQQIRKRHDYSTDTLDSFIHSAMNIEMVYLILLGISSFMENTNYNRVAYEQIDQSIRIAQDQSQSVIQKRLNGFGQSANSIKQAKSAANLRLTDRMKSKNELQSSFQSFHKKGKQNKKNKNVKKIQIQKDKDETKITFHNVRFQNVDMWDIENKSIQFQMNESQTEITSKLPQLQLFNGTMTENDHDGFVFNVCNEDQFKNQSKRICQQESQQKLTSSQFVSDSSTQKSPMFGRRQLKNQSHTQQNPSLRESNPNFDEEDSQKIEIVKSTHLQLDKNYQAGLSVKNSSIFLSSQKKTTLICNGDVSENSFQVVRPTVENDCTMRMIIENNADNNTVSLKNARNKFQNILQQKAKDMDTSQAMDMSRTGKLQKIFKNSVLKNSSISGSRILNIESKLMQKSGTMSYIRQDTNEDLDQPQIEVISTQMNEKVYQDNANSGKKGGFQQQKRLSTVGSIQNNELNMSVKSSINSYEDAKFAQIMFMDNIKPEDVIQSLSIEKNRNMVFRAGEGVGQSGSFFFFSHDNRFLIKTLRGKEKKNILNMLDDYIEHIKFTENKSLLARIYGVFTIKTNYFTPLDVIIMQNTSQLTNRQHKKMTFDLKGSTHGRLTGMPEGEEKFWRKNDFNQKKVMKDLNYLEINRDLSGQLMKLSKQQFEELDQILKLDSKFLSDHNLMDYSLLLVIEECPVEKESGFNPKKQVTDNNLSVIPEEKEPDSFLKSSPSQSKKNTSIQNVNELEISLEQSNPQYYDSLNQKNIFNDSKMNGIYSEEEIGLQNVNSLQENSLIRNQYKSVLRDLKDTTILTRQSMLNIRDSMMTQRESQANNQLRVPSFQGGWINNSDLQYSNSRKSENTVSRQSSMAQKKTKQYYQIYHVAIIDYLQEWSIPKRFENKVKVFYDKKNRDKISAVHPGKYQQRFVDFIQNYVTKPAYENFKTNAGYVETCERFIDSLIARIRIQELQGAGVTMHSTMRSSGIFVTPMANSSEIQNDDATPDIRLELSNDSVSSNSQIQKQYAQNQLAGNNLLLRSQILKRRATAEKRDNTLKQSQSSDGQETPAHQFGIQQSSVSSDTTSKFKFNVDSLDSQMTSFDKQTTDQAIEIESSKSFFYQGN